MTFDCANPRAVAEFWKAVLGYVDPPVPPGFESMAFAVASGTTTLNGQQVAMYTDSEDAAALFPVSGLAYLIEIRTSASGPTGVNTLTFTWNQPTKVAAPPQADIYTG